MHLSWPFNLSSNFKYDENILNDTCLVTCFHNRFVFSIDLASSVQFMGIIFWCLRFFNDCHERVHNTLCDLVDQKCISHPLFGSYLFTPIKWLIELHHTFDTRMSVNSHAIFVWLHLLNLVVLSNRITKVFSKDSLDRRHFIICHLLGFRKIVYWKTEALFKNFNTFSF